MIQIGTVQLSSEEWRQAARLHFTRAQEWTQPYRERRDKGQLHPIYDFLFIYYRISPGQLESWHPGVGVHLSDAQASDGFSSKHYRHSETGCEIDPHLIPEKAILRLRQAHQLCSAVINRPPQFGCFGMHEWAMVYRGDSDGEIRHGEKLPLRVTQDTINHFVETQPIRCSHFDAFRFFTPSACQFNRVQPAKDSRLELEQAGCLHTNMDLYKLAGQCMPWVGSQLLWNCFQYAVKARQLDMQASAYDCSSLGFDSVPVETPEGRAIYKERQQALSAEAQKLRSELIQQLDRILNAY
ncbi:hypothetical protein [Coraliomargarita akajimensis]|uniref:3-methyladenine DNA glycosylase n=1 Tax=Coraliomargarita akajimensis (strain DSM 45221 / IAM 15411 / JCM 23193 / KCTC 12865 / 04OKA010-24) TaxID=583355 RepID=D5EJ52_CORAD|nr:hypothetical protein [Coraliomargarita akajimensis]ADE54451.1 conserved hypothetical protein [Coraliomargarita akajimensis DSM 45221]